MISADELHSQGAASLETANAILRAANNPGLIISYDARLVRTSAPNPPTLTTGSEQEMEAASYRIRQAEVTPPTFTRFPLGTLAFSSYGEDSADLMELRECSLDDDRLTFPEGHRTGQVVEKYVAWIKAGSLPPPMRGYEMPDGYTIKIADGHFRNAALRLAQVPTTQVWVALTWKTSGITLRLAQELAAGRAGLTPQQAANYIPNPYQWGHYYQANFGLEVALTRGRGKNSDKRYVTARRLGTTVLRDPNGEELQRRQEYRYYRACLTDAPPQWVRV